MNHCVRLFMGFCLWHCLCFAADSSLAQPVPTLSVADEPLPTSELATAAQFADLQRQIDQLKSDTSAPPAASSEKTAAKTYPDFKMTGFFQVDSAYFAQSDESIATLGDIQDGTGFRRARLAATGNISERASYMMEFDMAQGQARFVDVESSMLGEDGRPRKSLFAEDGLHLSDEGYQIWTRLVRGALADLAPSS